MDSSIVRHIAEGAAQSLGSALAEELYSYLRDRCIDQRMEEPPVATYREVEEFISRSPYAVFVADKVIRDACFRFSRLPQQERQVVLALASNSSSPEEVVRQIVVYMRRRP